MRLFKTRSASFQIVSLTFFGALAFAELSSADFLVAPAALKSSTTRIQKHFAGAEATAEMAVASKQKETRIKLNHVTNGLNLYYTDCGAYPSLLQGLYDNIDHCQNWGPEAYMSNREEGLTDAWGHPFVYALVGNTFKIMSWGADNREGGEGEDLDIEI